MYTCSGCFHNSGTINIVIIGLFFRQLFMVKDNLALFSAHIFKIVHYDTLVKIKTLSQLIEMNAITFFPIYYRLLFFNALLYTRNIL